MTNFEKAVKLIVKDVMDDLDGYYSGWGIDTWSEYVDATGRDSKSVKEDVYYILNSNNVETNDYCEVLTEDGDIIPYRTLMNAVRKQLKVEEYLK